ncbi:MAG TPA: hypothetical protein VGH23_08945 [Rhizomicrobium sp.]|jgi:hypothetical protein
MKIAPATILSSLMFAASITGALADVNSAPLAPGKAAGVHNAQFEGGNAMFIVAGAALVGITVALATAGNGVAGAPNTSSTSTSTSTTGTSP